MAIPTSGSLSMSQFNTELGRASNTADSQLTGGSTPQVGSLVYIADLTGTINIISPFYFSDWYGYPTPPPRFYDGASSTGTSITLPTAMRQNDIVVVCSMSDDTTQNLPTGYTNGQNGVSNTVNYRWSYKQMGATPDTTVTGLSGTSVHIAMVFRNINTTTILDVASPAIATNVTGMPNSPSITTVTNNAIVIAMGFLDDIAVTGTAPTNFTIARTATYGNGSVMAAYRVLATAGAEDPGAFGGGGDDSWVGATAALRPL